MATEPPHGQIRGLQEMKLMLAHQLRSLSGALALRLRHLQPRDRCRLWCEETLARLRFSATPSPFSSTGQPVRTRRSVWGEGPPRLPSPAGSCCSPDAPRCRNSITSPPQAFALRLSSARNVPAPRPFREPATAALEGAAGWLFERDRLAPSLGSSPAGPAIANAALHEATVLRPRRERPGLPWIMWTGHDRYPQAGPLQVALDRIPAALIPLRGA